jgi:hypothetical protein
MYEVDGEIRADGHLKAVTRVLLPVPLTGVC